MTDLSGVVNEQKATIEALRRRVAELEGERDTANKYLDEVLDRGNKALGVRDALTAENTELKRQVEAMGEDAEVGQRLWQFLCQNQNRRIAFISHLTEGLSLRIGVRIGDDYQWWHDTPIEALREAANTGE